jgi:hypothetical protein
LRFEHLKLSPLLISLLCDLLMLRNFIPGSLTEDRYSTHHLGFICGGSG